MGSRSACRPSVNLVSSPSSHSCPGWGQGVRSLSPETLLCASPPGRIPAAVLSALCHLSPPFLLLSVSQKGVEIPHLATPCPPPFLIVGLYLFCSFMIIVKGVCGGGGRKIHVLLVCKTDHLGKALCRVAARQMLAPLKMITCCGHILGCVGRGMRVRGTVAFSVRASG